MRKFALLGSAVAVTVLASAGSAFAVSQTFSVKVSPNRASTKQKKVGTSLAFAGTIIGDPGQRPPHGNFLTIKGDSAFGVNKKAYKTFCDKDSLNANGSCPSDTVVATGTATADAAPLLAAPVTTAVTAYITTGSHVMDFLLYARASVPIDTVVIVPGYVTIAGGKPSIVTDAHELPTPLGQTINVTGLNVKTKLKKDSKGVPNIFTPKTCKKVWKATLTTSFDAPQPPISTVATSPCKKAKKKSKKK